MTDFLTIALAQKNPIVGDVKSNLAKMREARSLAAEKGADLVIATELCISGYPPEDLVLKRSFLEVVKDGVEELAKEATAASGAFVDYTRAGGGAGALGDSFGASASSSCTSHRAVVG